MNKIPYASQNMEAKTLPADVCVFGHFGQLSPAAVHSADCWFDSGVKWIHVSSIIRYLCKNSFLFQTTLWIIIVLFFINWANVTPILNTVFSLTNVCTKWWIPCVLISSTPLLSQNKFVEFFSVFQDNCQIWATSIICVCMTASKVGISPLNHCFQWHRVQITLIKPLLCLNSIFPIKKQCFINTWNSDFSIVLKICNCSFT